MSKRLFLYFWTLSQVIINLFGPRGNTINTSINCIVMNIYLYCNLIPIMVKINLITFICNDFICCIIGNYTNVSNTAIIYIYISNKFGIESTDMNFVIGMAKFIRMKQVIENRYGQGIMGIVKR